jgi:hypothetical protein
MKKTVLLSILLALLNHSLSAQGYLHRDNKNIVDGNGNNIILRGIGLGGWMLQEPYMLNLSSVAGTQHQIRAKIESTIGKENTDIFYQEWLKNYMQKADVELLKSFGFNSIRLPMHYNLFTSSENSWIDKGFVLVDSLLSWCTANQIYLILDMHAAPGGQGKDAAISDYDNTKSSLWESTENMDMLVALWKKLAERYANEKWIGGYDLINETNWDFEDSGNQNGCNCRQNTALWNCYRKIISAIREVDKNHMIIIEGNCWGNNYGGLGDLATFDSNMAISFHKYWNYNHTSDIQTMLNLRNSTNLPIWCGESGENSNVWYTQAISLFEANNIGWAWWTYKKFNSTSGINSVVVTPDYSNLVTDWSNGTSPDAMSAKTTLLKMAENLCLNKCITNMGVVDAMFRQVKTAETKPFIDVHVPGNIFAVNYDYGRLGAAYFDTDTADYHVSTTKSNWNSGYKYRNDGVDIESCNDIVNNGFDVGWTNNGEWMQYTVSVDSTSDYRIVLRYASKETSIVHFILNGVDITKPLTLRPSGDWTNWTDFIIDNVHLNKGINKIKLYFDQGGCNVNYIKFDYSNSAAIIPLEKISNSLIYPNPASNKIMISSAVAGKFSIYTTQGQLILCENYNPGKEIDIRKLSNGFYLTKLAINNTESYNTLIVFK